MLQIRQQPILLEDQVKDGGYFLRSVRLEIPSPTLAVFHAQLCGPEGSSVWARAWLSNAIEGGIVEAASTEMKTGDSVALELKLESDSMPELACIRIENAPLATQQVRCVNLGPVRRYHLERLILEAMTPDQMRTKINAMTEEQRSQLSESWQEQMESLQDVDPWVLGFQVIEKESGQVAGSGGFKGPPQDGTVEIAYGIEPEHQGKGYGTLVAEALTKFAFGHEAPRVIAHTLPETNASTRILTKCGFEFVGEVDDPEDGIVFRWERLRQQC